MSNTICPYCMKSFVRSGAFDNHYCKEMKRVDFLTTPKGKAAFHYYKEWLKVSRNNGQATEQTFLDSRYFTPFVKFIEYSNAMLLPNKSAYIRYMASLNVLPTHWCTDTMYINYIKNLDDNYTPAQQADETIRTLYELADIFECKPQEVFDSLQVGDFIKLLRARRLTPWILLLSKKFNNYCSVQMSPEQRMLVQTIINPTLWRTKFQNRPLEVEKMKKIVQELNL